MTTKTSSLSPLQISFGIHLLVLGAAILTQLQLLTFFRTEKVPIEVFVQPKTAPANLNINAPKPIAEKPKAAEPEVKKVFGVNRKALTTDQASPTTAEIKQGNTVAKENDNLILDKNDADSIPIPTDDYLVTSMPMVIKEVKAIYTPEATKAAVEGRVVANLLIDKDGRVREVKIIKGLGYGLDEAAIKALTEFQFRPAKVKDQNVPVLIRYTYRFTLEN